MRRKRMQFNLEPSLVIIYIIGKSAVQFIHLLIYEMPENSTKMPVTFLEFTVMFLTNNL